MLKGKKMVEITAQELRESVIEYRTTASESERAEIRDYWREMGIPNHIIAGVVAGRMAQGMTFEVARDWIEKSA